MEVWENSKLRGNTRGSLGELKIAWKQTWKFGRTQNCVETYVEVWENSKLRANTRGSLGELKIAWKHTWKFGRTQNCVQTLVEVWENSKLRGNTRPTGSPLQFLVPSNSYSCFYNCMENILYFLTGIIFVHDTILLTKFGRPLAKMQCDLI